MKHLIIISMILIGLLGYGQADFERGMQTALTLMQENKLEQSENLFERIAQAETERWLPHYYIAQINSLKSWNIKDKTILIHQLDKAQNHLDKAMAISSNNPELLIMQAQILTNWVAYDGQTYGMKYSGKINDLYKNAVLLDDSNPRAILGKAEWDMGSAQFFGKDTKPFCKNVERSLELFANFKPESEFHPNWGESRARQVLKNCE